MTKSPFEYDENNRRININGSTTTRTADEQIIYNLRYKYKNTLDYMPDEMLLNLYDEFSMSDMFGDNDERFIEFIELMEGNDD